MNEFSGIYEGIMSGEILADPTMLLSMVTFPVALIAAALLVLTAIYGYRIFKTTISVTVCVACGVVGSTLAPFILASLPIPAIEGVSLSAIVGVVLAGIGLLLGFKLYKLSLFISCAVGSYFVYTPVATLIAAMLPDVPLLNSPEGLMIVSAVLALLTGILMLLLFKPLYIIITSIGGVALAVGLIAVSVAPGYPVAGLVGLGVGALLGIPAAKHQFKCDEK